MSFKKRPLTGLIIAGMLLTSQGVFAAEDNAIAANQSEELTMNMQDADIRGLIHWVAEKTGKNIIIDPRVKGKVTVLAPETLTSDESYQVFLSVLQVHGYAAVETNEAIKIIPDVNAKQINIPLIEKGSDAQGDEVVVRVIKVKNVAVAQLVQLLRPLIPQVGHLAAYPASNALIISDRASNINRIVGIIQSIDKVGNIDINIIPLKYASAKEVIKVLTALIPKGSKDDAGSFVTFAADERSNSILMSGDPARREQIEKLIARLDTPLEGEGNTQVIYLHYSKAKDIVPILEGIAGSAQKAEKDQKQASVEVNIQSSEATNAIVITAPPSILETMKSVIKKLDIRRAQVLVEALIVEVSTERAKELGVQWNTSDSATTGTGDGVFGGTRLSTTNSPSFDGFGDNVSISNNGITLGFYSNGSLRALVNALAADTSSNILSTPTLVTLDNEEAEIVVGQNVPFVTGKSTSDSSSTDNPFQTIERQDVGVKLKILPQINQGDSITLDIEQEVSSISPSTVAEDIITNTREIKTRVLIEDNQVLVLGGLISDERDETENKVPLLGDIPILGYLFKSTTNDSSKNNLMVFIHPVILKDKSHVEDVTKQRYDFVRDAKQEYEDRSWFIEDKFIIPDFENAYPTLTIDPAAE